ncbi:hypothetical protein GJ496_007065 [Pomphorhynchus laevis]|nr:hypothetical protein GJ496_007065 [Pomphorhynchus laevis]
MRTPKRNTSSSRGFRRRSRSSIWSRNNSDLRGSMDKKSGSTKRSASILHASSTRVSTKCIIRIKDVMGDGNCLFQSLSDQMIGKCNEHLEYRIRLPAIFLLILKILSHFSLNMTISRKA